MNTELEASNSSAKDQRAGHNRLRCSIFLLLLLLEAAPVIGMWLFGGVWPLNNFEDFSTAFWAPVKAGCVPSYFFNQSGFYFSAVLKLVHQLTDTIVGSPEVTYHHLQVFGYAVRIVYGAATLGMVALFWRGRDTVAVLLSASLLVAFHLAAPLVVQLYHLRVGLQLSYVFFMVLISLATLDALERCLDGRAPRRLDSLYWGGLAGATLLEAPHYVSFFLPLFVLGMPRSASLGEWAGRLWRWSAGALLGMEIGLLGLYGFDIRSATAAALSNFRGIVSGFPQQQPGFEQFANLVFDPASSYFHIKIALALQCVVIAVFTIWSGWALRRRPGRFRYAAFVIVGSFVVVWLVHWQIWRTHGSYTTVISMVYCGFLSVALVILLQWRAREQGDRSGLTTGCIVIAAAGLLLPSATTLQQFSYRTRFYHERDMGESFRSFNVFLDRFPRPLGLAFNGNISYYPLIAHCNFAGIMYHMGSSVGPADTRFLARIQREHFPGFELLYSERVVAADYDLGRAHLNAVIESGYPRSHAPSMLVPLSRQVGTEWRATLEKAAHLVPAREIPAGQDLARFQAAHPDWGMEFDHGSRMNWLFLPINTAAAREEILREVWPDNWSRQERSYYLVSTPLGFYLLGLRGEPKPGDEAEDPPAAVMAPATPRARELVRSRIKSDYGELDLRLRLPLDQTGQAEPLVSTGLQGAGDILYVVYSDSAHVRLGFDHWSKGGPLTALIAIDYAKEHRWEIAMGSLLPPVDDAVFVGMPRRQAVALKKTLRVKLDGAIVFEATVDFYDSFPGQIAIGENLIHGSTCNPEFTGSIMGHGSRWPAGLAGPAQR